MQSNQSLPIARDGRPRAPAPFAPRVPELQVSIDWKSASSWLHLLKLWSLRQTRSGSVNILYWAWTVTSAIQASHCPFESKLAQYAAHGFGRPLHFVAYTTSSARSHRRRTDVPTDAPRIRRAYRNAGGCGRPPSNSQGRK